jgi:hypothetical protein
MWQKPILRTPGQIGGISGMQCPRCNTGNIPEGGSQCPECGFSLAGGEKRRAVVSPEVEKSIRRAFRPKFRIEGLLGRGGMSLVYLAHEVELNRFVALKVLPLQLALGTDAAERFKREARIAASLDHPHIVPIHQIGSRSTFLWFTMKFVKGSSLVEYIAERGAMDLVGCLGIVEQVASALHYAHERGVVHRDVKPANVLIDEHGWALVCDFGVAKAFGAVPLTKTGGTLGTPSHMSPEQLYGQALTSRSDQYSLAIMTYECLAGTPPFDGESLGEVLRQHCLEPAPHLSDLRTDIPKHVSDALHRAMSKKPDERFDTVVDFVVALGGRRLGSSEGSQSRVLARTAPVRTRRFGRPRRLRPGHLPLVAAFGSLLFAGLVLVASFARSFPQDSLAQMPVPLAPGDASSLRGLDSAGSGSLGEGSDYAAILDVLPGGGTTAVETLSKVFDGPRASQERLSSSGNDLAPAAPAPLAQLESVVARLARAMESLSVDSLAEMYVNLAADERSLWRGFFESLLRLSVTLEIERVDISGSSATARLNSRYDFERFDGTVGQHDDRLEVTLAKVGIDWQVTAIKTQ